MSEVLLDDFELDPNCYKVRLGLALLGIEYTKVPVNCYPAAPGTAPDVPVLRHGDHTIRGAESALLHLATEFAADTDWAPAEAVEYQRLTHWLDFCANEFGAICAAREMALYTTDPLDEAVDRARAVVQQLEDHLALQRIDNHWVIGPHPGIADIALFAGAALTRDIGIDRGRYPALRWWLRRVQSLPGFIAMPGIPVFP